MDLQPASGLLGELLLFVKNYQIPIMFGLGIFAIILKTGSYLTIKLLQSFVRHIEVNVMELINDEKGLKSKIPRGFYNLTKFIFEKSYNEQYFLKHKYQRRSLDRLTTIADRTLLIQEGSQRVLNDALSHAKYFDKFENKPEFSETTKYLVNSNPVFKRVFGIFPMETVSELLAVLPNIFVVLGIFGTFIGIMFALPELAKIDLSDIEKTKVLMNNFLLGITFSMNTSLVGIILSVLLNLLNASFSTDVLNEQINETLNNSFTLIWNESHSGIDHGDSGEKPIKIAK